MTSRGADAASSTCRSMLALLLLPSLLCTSRKPSRTLDVAPPWLCPPIILAVLPTLQFARMRKDYVPLYIEHLRSPIDPSRPHDRLPKGIVDMDRRLPEQTIVMFR